VTASDEHEGMTSPSSDRTGILILHLWIEAAADEGFRARITQTFDSAGPEQAMATAATPEDIYSVVQTWVEAFLDPNRANDLAPTTVGATPV
jgi:hypothetical protein